jgi:hypothetical protein
MAWDMAMGALFRLVVLLQNEQAVMVLASSIRRASSAIASASSDGNRALSAATI